MQPAPADTLKLGLEPPSQAVDHLELHVMVMTDAQLGPVGLDHADHMRSREAVRCLSDAQITIGRVAAQSPGLKGSLVMVAEDEAVLLVG